jgi:hypothetical protein
LPLLGMVVALNTFDSADAGTDDEIYIGLWGTGGGREFPLSSSGHDDFERGAADLYMVGLDPGFGFRHSDRSNPGEANDPALVPIDLDSIQYVYVRKQAYGTQQDDNAWRLAQVIVLLYDAATLPLPRNRMFFLDARKGMWFGNEHGHQAWLLESRVSAPGVRGFVDKLGAKAFRAATSRRPPTRRPRGR